MYEKFRGDADGWVYSAEGRSDPKLADVWRSIDTVVMNLRLMASESVSDAFRRDVEASLVDLTAGDALLQTEVRRVAEASRHWSSGTATPSTQPGPAKPMS